MVLFLPSFVARGDPSAAQLSQLQFGRLFNNGGQRCVLDPLSGSVSGAGCASLTATPGVLRISGTPGMLVDLSVTAGGFVNGVRFTPTVTDGFVAPTANLTNLTLAGGFADIRVGGTAEMNGSGTAGSSVLIGYTIDVVYH